MDSILANIDSLYALLGLCVLVFGGLVIDKRRREDKRVQPAQVTAAPQTEQEANPSSNGRGVSANYVNRVVAENCRDCKRIEDVEQQISRMNTDLCRRLERIEGILMERKVG